MSVTQPSQPTWSPRLIEFPCHRDQRGNLTVAEGEAEVPFAIKRVYYLHDVPGGTTRGGHAHLELEQIILAVAGSFDVTLYRGRASKTYSMNRANVGLYVPPMHWRELGNFSSGSVCLVLASQPYWADDYLFDFGQFIESTS